jgi:hypothetical protein
MKIMRLIALFVLSFAALNTAIHRNGLWIDLPRGISSGKDLTNQYVLIEGVFDGKQNGHMGLWSGTITDVTRLESWGYVRDL